MPWPRRSLCSSPPTRRKPTISRFLAIEISERWHVPVLLRMTTRVCHSKAIMERREQRLPARPADYTKNMRVRSMMPANARPAHRRLREKLHQIAQWCEQSGPTKIVEGSRSLGIITSGHLVRACA